MPKGEDAPETEGRKEQMKKRAGRLAARGKCGGIDRKGWYGVIMWQMREEN